MLDRMENDSWRIPFKDETIDDRQLLILGHKRAASDNGRSNDPPVVDSDSSGSHGTQISEAFGDRDRDRQDIECLRRSQRPCASRDRIGITRAPRSCDAVMQFPQSDDADLRSLSRFSDTSEDVPIGSLQQPDHSRRVQDQRPHRRRSFAASNSACSRLSAKCSSSQPVS